jgi:hypothetical protein
MTRASDTSPTKRVLTDADGVEYVVMLSARLVTIRPLGSRRSDAAVVLPVASIYRHGLMARAEREVARSKRTRRVKRGLL